MPCGEQNWNFIAWCLWGCHFYKLEISETVTSPHGISGVLFLWTSILLKTACFTLNSTALKIPQKRTNNIEAFNSVNSGNLQNTNGLLTGPRISSTIYQKFRMDAFVHSFQNQLIFSLPSLSLNHQQ